MLSLWQHLGILLNKTDKQKLKIKKASALPPRDGSKE
jgi:hypothetical protein